jgi:hypothetical protein
MTTTRVIALWVSVGLISGCSGFGMTSTPAPAPSSHKSTKQPVFTTNPPPSTAAPAARVGLPQLALGTVSGAAGQTVLVSAILRSGSERLAGTQNDIGFDPRQIAIPAKSNGKPDCAANGALGKEGTAFSFLPSGCQKSGNCSSVRALVLSLSNVEPIADGAVLYTCRVTIAAGASAGAHPLAISRVGFSSPNGQAVHGAGANGSVTVK